MSAPSLCTSCSVCGFQIPDPFDPDFVRPGETLPIPLFNFLSAHRLHQFYCIAVPLLSCMNYIDPLVSLIMDYEGHSYVIGEMIDFKTNDKRWDKAVITGMLDDYGSYLLHIGEYCFGTVWEPMESDRIARAFSKRPNRHQWCWKQPHYTLPQYSALPLGTLIDVFDGQRWVNGRINGAGLVRIGPGGDPADEMTFHPDETCFHTAPLASRNKGSTAESFSQRCMQVKAARDHQIEMSYRQSMLDWKQDRERYDALMKPLLAAGKLHLQMVWVGIPMFDSIIRSVSACLNTTDALYHVSLESRSCIDSGTFYARNWGCQVITSTKFLPINARLFIISEQIGIPIDASDPGGDRIMVDLNDQVDFLRGSALPAASILISNGAAESNRGSNLPTDFTVAVQWPQNEEQIRLASSGSSNAESIASSSAIVSRLLDELRASLPRVDLEESYRRAFRQGPHRR